MTKAVGRTVLGVPQNRHKQNRAKNYAQVNQPTRDVHLSNIGILTILICGHSKRVYDSFAKPLGSLKTRGVYTDRSFAKVSYTLPKLRQEYKRKAEMDYLIEASTHFPG
jgi:hypothetical protein